MSGPEGAEGALPAPPPVPRPPLPPAPPPEPPTGNRSTERTGPDDTTVGVGAQRLVAVLIMVVTLLGAVFAFLQTQAGNRESSANRSAQAAAIQATTDIVDGNRAINQDDLAWELQDDQGWFRFYLEDDTGPAASFARALARAYDAAQRDLKDLSVVERTGTYKLPDDEIDWARFYEDQYRASYSSTEFQRAHAEERDGWSAKGSQYVTVITVLAMALFLLGLTLTVPAAARRPFLVTGTIVAVVGTAWGATVWLRPVERPSAEAIEAYVDGQVLLNAGSDTEDFQQAVDRFGAAIRARPDYVDAYVSRGNAYFELDFLNPDGPQGSMEAVADFQRAIDLGLNDVLSWGNLGAAQWWLGEYDAALESTRTAFELDRSDITVSLNYAEVLLTAGGLDDPGYRSQLRHVRGLLERAPTWLRDSKMESFYEAVDLAVRYRPDLAELESAFKEAMIRIHHEIDLNNELYGRPRPEPVDATITDLQFTLSPDHTTLDIDFDYAGVAEGQRWLYRTYVDGLWQEDWSIEPEPWPFDVPDGGVTITLTGSFDKDEIVRTEIFLEGNLLAAGELTVP